MANYAVPKHSKKAVRRAGDVLVAWHSKGQVEFSDYLDALEVINNFRQIHAFPLNTFQVTLKKRSRQVDPDSVVAQRIKRLSSIRAKLERFPTLNLSQMQDIGGGRAVLNSVPAVQALVDSYIDSDLKHTLHTHDDYIESPKPSGYRGHHLVYVYYSDRVATYNGLKIELQLRSQFQHAWATAVEIVGTFTKQALKSSQGEGDWLRFFALMGSAIARMEGTAIVPGTPAFDDEFVKELREVEHSIGAVNRLRAFGIVPDQVEGVGAKGRYFLLELNVKTNELNIQSFTASEVEKASDEYLAAEKRLTDDSDAVLVSVESLSALRKAYPNYYADTDMFVSLVEEALDGAFYQ